MTPVYLDYNATTPLDPEVLAELTRVARDHFHNPSSRYPGGKDAKGVIDDARAKVKQMLNAPVNSHVYFTASATEASNWLLYSIVTTWEKHRLTSNCKPHIIISAIEHDAISAPAQQYAVDGRIDLTIVQCQEEGRMDLKELAGALCPTTVLVCGMLANNETGIIQPVKEYVDALRAYSNRHPDVCTVFPKILYYTDAAQAIGKIKVDVQDLGVDYLSLTGHKFYGPRMGAIYVHPSSPPLEKWILGGNQEFGLRGGTENVPQIAALGMACDVVLRSLDKCANSMKKTRDELEKGLEAAFQVTIHGKHVDRLPNTLNIALALPANFTSAKAFVDGAYDYMLCSTGAACHSDSQVAVSKILLNSGVSEANARCSVRFSTGRGTTVDQIHEVISHIKKQLLVPN